MKKRYVTANCELLLLKSEDIMFLKLSSDYDDEAAEAANKISLNF